MKLDREKWLVGGIILVFLLVIALPYIYAKTASDENRVFGGFLLNPIDGNSYLAKMRQGFEGSWTFKLAYTAEPGAGAALNLYYLLLGHLSRILGWSLIFTFHAARIVGSLLLGLALYNLFSRLYEDVSARFVALGLALFGSGLGWLAAGLGLFTSDFWVAEAYPFLASFANPHFPLGLALQMWLITPLEGKQRFGWWQATGALAASALLSAVYPFGWVVAVSVSGVWALWLAWTRETWRLEFLRWACMLAGGALYVAYSLWVVNTHPILAQWNSQNLTPAPDIVDLIISLSPALLLSLSAAIVVLWNGGKLMGLAYPTTKWSRGVGKMGIWLVVGVLIVYLPINLQRRLISGLYVPVVALAVFAWEQVSAAPLRRRLAVATLILSLPTNLLIISGGFQAAREQNAAIFVYTDELAAFRWLDENASTDSLVMAAPDTGLLIPAYSSTRVLYGHPFETVEAEVRLKEVSRFYSGEMDGDAINDLLSTAGVTYVFYGPREREIGQMSALNGRSLVFEQGEVQIWALNQ